MSGIGPQRPADRDAQALAGALRRTLPAVLATWLPARRWFADKGREFERIEVEDLCVRRYGEDWVVLVIARVPFREGDPARYFLPLTVARDHGRAFFAIDTGNGSAGVLDASDASWFGAWVLDQLIGRSVRPGTDREAAGDPDVAPAAALVGATPASPAYPETVATSSSGAEACRPGRWHFAADPAAAALLQRARAYPAQAMGAEQSNTSLRYGQTLIVKLVRRLQPGPNPDQEMLGALSAAGFPHVPRYAGGALWRDEAGNTYPLALAQAFVPNEGDGWTWMLQRLARISSAAIDREADGMAAERLLGRRTAEMHVALAALDSADFAPVMPGEATIAADVARVRAAGEQAAGLLEERRGDLPAAVAGRLPEIARGLRGVAARADGFRDEAETFRIRVHGDYHLGQTLRAPDGDWTIVDFEGEPARPVAERRQKHSVLKDVAGMLRSFGYARGAAERSERADAGSAADRLRHWEARARGAFLTGYTEVIRRGNLPLVPADESAFRRALTAWELDKALYEIAYEARNRPDWLELPLRALLPELDDQVEGAAPGAPA